MALVSWFRFLWFDYIIFIDRLCYTLMIFKMMMKMIMIMMISDDDGDDDKEGKYYDDV